MELSALRRDCAVKQQRGLHFILASVFIWAGHFSFARRLDANSGGVGGDDVGHRGGVLVGFGVGE